MTQVISATYTRFDRMSPTAAALAVLLHLATALALWWVSPLNHRAAEFEDQAIDVTIEQPKPAPPPVQEAKPSPPPVAAKLPPPAPPKAAPAPLGLPPPSPTTAETPKQAAPKEAMQPPQPQQQPKPQEPPSEPQKEEKEQQQQQQALAPQETVPPPPPLESSLPPLEAPPPPLTSKDFPKPPPQAPTRPQTHAAPAAPQQQPLRPSPLSPPQQRAPGGSQATAPSATFVNPADQYNQSRVIDQYLWSVANKISQYRYHSNQANEQGTVVLRLVISRDGRLLDVSIARSSGILNLDRGLIEAARAAAPYAPLPSVISGPQVAVTLPFASVYRAR